MKWVKLKLYDYSNVLEECSYIALLFQQLSDNIQKTNNQDYIREFFQLQEEVITRIQELKLFIERFSFDSRISHFIRAKKQHIKNLNNYNINSTTLIDNESNISKSRVKSQSVVKDKNNDHENEISNQRYNYNSKQGVRGNSQVNESRIGRALNQTNINTNSNLNVSQQQKLPKKITQDKLYHQKPEPSEFKNKNNPKFGDKLDLDVDAENIEVNFNTQKQGKVDYNDFNQWKEIVFKIKLSSEEYELLMQEKLNKRNTTNVKVTG